MILEKALSVLNSSSVNVELSSLLQKLESKTIEEILKIGDNDEMWQVDSDIRMLCSITAGMDYKDVAGLIITEQNYLKRGIENGDVKLILIFLCVNCYLQIDIRSLLTELEYSEDSKQLTSDRIGKVLQGIEFEITALADAPYHEIEMIRGFQQGIKENNIKNTYQFVESVERGRLGFHFNFLLEHLVSFLHQLDYPRFLKHISEVKNLQKLIFYLQSFEMEQLLCLSNAPLLTGKWLNFELIRQIVRRAQKDEFEEIECIAIKKTLAKIDADDFDFFKQTIQWFHRSKLFNAALGELLISFADYKIQEILSDCFAIDQYYNNYEARKKMLERFESNAPERQVNVFLEAIYNKWHSYFNGLFVSEDFFLNDVLLTDFCDFIALYYIRIASEVDVIDQMYEAIVRLTCIDTQWFVSSVKQSATFHLFYSKLYILSFAYKERQLKDARIAALFFKIKCDGILLHRYFKEEKMKSLRVIDENLS